MWQGRRFRFLLSIIDQLPAHSRYAEAVSQDDELAEAMVNVEIPDSGGPRLSSWSQEVAELRVVSERLGIVAQLLGVLSHNPYTPTPLPRPETARERARLAANLRRHRRLTAQLIRTAEEVSDGLSG